MKKRIVMLMAVMSICCFIGCGSNDVVGEGTKDSQQEVVAGNEGKEADGGEAASESEAEVTSEVAGEATDEESTEESSAVVYEGIDMESTLPGEEWIATFVGVIEEPKVVIFNDETGRKEIVEEGAKVTFNPDTDVMALYLPEGYEYANSTTGLTINKIYNKDFGLIFGWDSEKTRETKAEMAAVDVKHNGEETALNFVLISE